MAVFTGKRAVIAAVLSATARITPGQLRGQENDGMDAIIARVAEQRKFLADLN